MTTKFTYFAFSKQFEFYDHFFPFIFEWDPLSKELSTNYSKKHMFSSYFGLFMVIIGFIGSVVTGYHLAHLEIWTRQEYCRAIVTLTFGIICFLETAWGIFYIENADEVAVLFNAGHIVLFQSKTFKYLFLK